MKFILMYLLISIIASTNIVSAQTVPNDLEIEIHQLINIERNSKDLKSLKLCSVLIEIARKHSEDMLLNNFFNHVNLDGQDPFDRIDEYDIIYSAAAENLYFSTGVGANKIPQNAVEGWIDSPGHYTNMLSDTSYTGIGIASSDSTYYITQVFLETDESHLDNLGVIYENTWSEESGFEFTSMHGYIIFGLLLVMLYLLDIRSKSNRRRRA